MKKVIAFLAEGFEDIELVGTVDLLRRAGVTVELVSITDKKEVKAGLGHIIITDKTIKEVNIDDYDMLFLPGGKGVQALDNNEFVRESIQKLNDNGKYITAICAAPLIFGKLGILDGKKFTCYPEFEQFMPKGIYRKVGVVKDGNIITGRGVGYVFDFALKLIEVLEGKEVKDKIASGTLVKESKRSFDSIH